MNAIKLRNLHKTYRGSSQAAVDDLNLEIPPGQVLGFLGPNGAGKTTSIKMMCGLIRPDGGDAWLNGYHVQRQRREAMRQFGAVLEGTRNIYWRLSAWQNLMFFARLKSQTGTDVKQRAERLLTELGLWADRDRPVRHFSRGMQQKVAIACALIADPPIVLLDEPTLGLDVQASRTVKAWIEQLAREHNKTIILTTHQLDVAQELCERIAIIRAGDIIADHPIDEVLGLFEQESITIRVTGVPDEQLIASYNLNMTRDNDLSILMGKLNDPDRLDSLLHTLHQRGHVLTYVNRNQLNLEDIFIELIEEQNL